MKQLLKVGNLEGSISPGKKFELPGNRVHEYTTVLETTTLNWPHFDYLKPRNVCTFFNNDAIQIPRKYT